LKNLKPEQKQQQIDELKAQKREREEKHKIMAEAKPPKEGDEAHTISDLEHLRELQREWNNEHRNLLPLRQLSNQQVQEATSQILTSIRQTQLFQEARQRNAEQQVNSNRPDDWAESITFQEMVNMQMLLNGLSELTQAVTDIRSQH